MTGNMNLQFIFCFTKIHVNSWIFFCLFIYLYIL